MDDFHRVYKTVFLSCIFNHIWTKALFLFYLIDVSVCLCSYSVHEQSKYEVV